LITTAAGSQPLLYSQTGNTTSTTTLTVLTSASYAAVVDDLATEVTLAQGDCFWYTHGTDAQVSQAVAIECVVIPGSTSGVPNRRGNLALLMEALKMDIKLG